MNKWWIGALAVAGTWLLTIAVFPSLPQRIPIHWNAAGEPDGWSARSAAFLLPGIMTGVWLLLRAIPHLEPRRESFQRSRATYELTVNLVLLFLFAFQVLALGTPLGWRVDVGRGTDLLLGLLFVALGNVMPRLRPNYFAGVRTPWTLESESVWRDTHRVAGRLMVGAGLIVLLGALTLPKPAGTYVTLAAILGAALASTVYSYLLWKREQNRHA